MPMSCYVFRRYYRKRAAPTRKLGTLRSKTGSTPLMQRDNTKLFVTSYPTPGHCFEKFILKLHMRQDDQSYTDIAISTAVMLVLMERLEGALEVANGDVKEEGAILLLA